MKGNQAVAQIDAPTCRPPKWYTLPIVHRIRSGQCVGTLVANQNSRLITYCWRISTARAKLASTIDDASTIGTNARLSRTTAAASRL